MANTIEYAKKYLPVIDDIYKAQSVTALMDTVSQADFSGANEIKILNVSTTGLGDYSRTDGYPKGDVSVSWETVTLNEERGKELCIDRMDDEETLGMAFGTVTGSFMRDWVNPELDAYRFAKYAGTEGILTTADATLDETTLAAALDEAIRAMDECEVPEAGRILFINSELKPVINASFTRQWSSEGAISTTLNRYNDIPVIYVPKSRFYTNVEINDGSTAWGYSKAADAKSINFMLIHPSAIMQVKKFAFPKIFSPDENQDKDMWKFQFRLYHDCYVYENKKNGIYLHTSDK